MALMLEVVRLVRLRDLRRRGDRAAIETNRRRPNTERKHLAIG